MSEFVGRRREQASLTAKVASGAIAAVILVGAGVVALTDSSETGSDAGAQALPRPPEVVSAPVAAVSAPIAVLPAWVEQWRADPPQLLGSVLRERRTSAAAAAIHRPVLVAPAPAARANRSTTHSVGPTKVTHSGQSYSQHTSWRMRRVTSSDGTTTTQSTTTRTTTVGHKTTRTTHTHTTVTPPSHRSNPPGATLKPVQKPAPVQHPAPVQRPAPVATSAPSSAGATSTTSGSNSGATSGSQ